MKLINMLEIQLSDLSDMCAQASDGDSYGLFDTMEHIVGLAMVAGQTYIATACGAIGVEKSNALKMGPAHSAGRTKVEIINHAANYWKHNNEWSNRGTDRRRQAIEEAFDSVGFPVGTDYPLSGILTELCNPSHASIELVSEILQEWKDEVINDA
ncbi:hypothetical protein GCM10027395_23330 [Giesbergeria sinuosa]